MREQLLETLICNYGGLIAKWAQSTPPGVMVSAHVKARMEEWVAANSTSGWAWRCFPSKGKWALVMPTGEVVATVCVVSAPDNVWRTGDSNYIGLEAAKRAAERLFAVRVEEKCLLAGV